MDALAEEVVGGLHQTSEEESQHVKRLERRDTGFFLFLEVSQVSIHISSSPLIILGLVLKCFDDATRESCNQEAGSELLGSRGKMWLWFLSCHETGWARLGQSGEAVEAGEEDLVGLVRRERKHRQNDGDGGGEGNAGALPLQRAQGDRLPPGRSEAPFGGETLDEPISRRAGVWVAGRQSRSIRGGTYLEAGRVWLSEEAAAMARGVQLPSPKSILEGAEAGRRGREARHVDVIELHPEQNMICRWKGRRCGTREGSAPDSGKEPTYILNKIFVEIIAPSMKQLQRKARSRTRSRPRNSSAGGDPRESNALGL